jgi:hypothetical protein
MTALDKLEPASIAPRTPAAGHHLAEELSETLALAVPMARNSVRSR